jgi:hypothetical protein
VRPDSLAFNEISLLILRARARHAWTDVDVIESSFGGSSPAAISAAACKFIRRVCNYK